MEYLVGLSNLKSLVSFWDIIGKGATWETAFQSAFSKTINVFYSEFETYRSTQGAVPLCPKAGDSQVFQGYVP